MVHKIVLSIVWALLWCGFQLGLLVTMWLVSGPSCNMVPRMDDLLVCLDVRHYLVQRLPII